MDVILRNCFDAVVSIVPPPDPRTANFLIIKHGYITFLIIGLYYYIVRSLGPRLMKNREPIDCKNAMIHYNYIQIIWNGFLVYLTIRYFYLPGHFSLFCSPLLPPGDDYHADTMAQLTVVYYLNKVFDLLDTMFMILRKKKKQMSPLHVNHHALIIFASWFAMKFGPGGFSTFFGSINSFVHTIMYGYYLLTILYPQYKDSIWWKRHITELQMLQFAAIGIAGLLHIFNPSCNFPAIVFFVAVPIHFYNTYMFWIFYKKTYLQKNESKRKL